MYHGYYVLIITLRFNCGEKKIWYGIKRYQNIMCIIVVINTLSLLHRACTVPQYEQLKKLVSHVT